MHGRDLTSILDLSADELAELLNSALAMKRDGAGNRLPGRTLALIFEKPSLRTRVSFEVGMARLGGRSLYIGAHEVKLGEREPIKDAARVLSRMVDAIAVRTFDHATIEEFARWAGIPVINALSDAEHPCQALADLLTLRERFGDLRGLHLTYFGEGNNVAISLAYASVLAGIEFTCASPEGFELPNDVLERARALAGSGSVRVTNDPVEAAAGANALYTDVWASMGQEHELQARLEPFGPFQLNDALVATAPAEAIVLHDLPAHRGEEITDEVIESDRSAVFDQAENRVYAQQAVLAHLLEPSASPNSSER
ncbi:MAG: ornithine carbamoyltransferase [Dehalococcoidia bacterium]